ncbi:hypothetical protein OS493_029733 [Desmophyllum pertusum]|uniref:Major facilitator superfamily (MFS) profile domain-containing protein n=1 Tax=Desmophyllum pertusum TaxID=174260 RepID=A0A9W9Z8Z5_9CNID|nr:hypothetical protein OS493_029733 [Desmophyllum pertusum]
MIKCKRLQHHPDSVYSWVVSICASMCQALNLGFSVSYGVLLPELMKQFSEEDRQKTVWVGSLAIALTFFLGPLGSVLCERIGCRFTAIAGCLICVLSLLLTSYSSSLQWMFVTYSFLYGLGSSLMFSSYFLVTAKNFRRWQSLAVGIVSVGGSIGVLIMGPLLQHLIDMVGWRGTYRIISVPFFVMAWVCGATFGDPIQDPPKSAPQNCSENPRDLKILSLKTLSTMETGVVNLGHVDDLENTAIHNNGGKSSEERKEDVSECHNRKVIESTNEIKSLDVVAASTSEDENSTGSSNTGKLSKHLDFSVFKVPSYTIVVISLTMMNFGHYIPQIHLVKYCLDLGISADSASRLFIFLGLSSSVARIVSGRLCDVTWVNPILIYQFGDLLVGFATVVLPVIRSYTGILAFAVIYGFGDGIFITTMNTLLMFTVDEKGRAAALGLGSSLLSIGIAVGPPMAGEQA